MRDKETEKFVKELLKERFDIECRKIPENKGQDGRTPDFLLFKNDINFAVCEIKEITDDVNDGTWEKRNDDDIESYEKMSNLDTTKIASKINDAYGQMKSHNLQKVLILVNYWSDYVSSLSEVLKKFNNEYIGKAKNNIDLYIWIDKGSVGREDKIHFRYFDNKSTGQQLRQNYFK